MPRKPRTNGPDFEREHRLIRAGCAPVAGIDEAGRGPWAGPVVAAAVILDPDSVPDGLDDSKALTAAARERLFDVISQDAMVGVGVADVARIDRTNILCATHWAMQQALAKLPRSPAIALIDGNRAPDLFIPAETIVGGDAKVASIAAASIIAKVTRDRLMIALSARYPAYGFERHKGYGTAEHREAIQRYGISCEHRRSFAPIRAAITESQSATCGES